ncbi:MAG: Uma2 family endonuclease [Gemmatimonadaceae bacterium]|nr:Uma2 family endonuclease [Gemmatimonadaceae bacterium]
MAYRVFMPLAEEWTAERARALPDDGNRYEVLDGLLAVTPAPSWRHQDVAFLLQRALQEYLRHHALGRAICAPADVEFSSRRLLQPDLFVVPHVAGRAPARWEEVQHLLLAVEVRSPSTARHDRHTKRAIYMAETVDEYWIVDAEARVVERWRRDEERPEIVAEQIAWRPTATLPALDIDLVALFREAMGE